MNQKTLAAEYSNKTSNQALFISETGTFQNGWLIFIIYAAQLNIHHFLLNLGLLK